jgi:hypothetical protein
VSALLRDFVGGIGTLWFTEEEEEGSWAILLEVVCPSSYLGFRLRDSAYSRKLRMDHQENQLRIYLGPTSCFLEHERDEQTDHSVFKMVE